MKRQAQVLGAAAVAGMLLLLLTRGGERPSSSATESKKAPPPEKTPNTHAHTHASAQPSAQEKGAPQLSPDHPAPPSSGWGSWLALGAGLGLTLWFFHEPIHGEQRRRRARTLGEQALSWLRAHLPATLGGTAPASSESEGQSWMPDRLLRDQLLQALSGIMPNPRKLQLQVKRGLVRVSGVLPAELHEQVLRCIHEVPGVVEVDAQLQTH